MHGLYLRQFNVEIKSHFHLLRFVATWKLLCCKFIAYKYREKKQKQKQTVPAKQKQQKATQLMKVATKIYKNNNNTAA